MNHFWCNARRSLKSVLLVILSAFSLVSEPAVRFAQAQGLLKEHNGRPYTIYQVDLHRQRLELWSRDTMGIRFQNAGSIKSFVEKRGDRLLFATNAGIFDRSFLPLGLHVENGRQFVPLNTDEGQGNFFMKPNGIFYIVGRSGFIVSTQAFDPKLPVDIASQSGPLLLDEGVINGSFNPHSTNRLIRSGVGVREQSQVIFAISDEPITFYEFGEFFKNGLKCTSALYLDGVISAMYAPDLQREQLSGDFAAMFVVLKKPQDQ